METKQSTKTDLRKLQMLSSADLMRLLGIGKTSFYQMRATGKLPKPVKLGTIQRWKLSDIEAWQSMGCPTAEKFEALRKAGAK